MYTFSRAILMDWVLDALRANGGSSNVVGVSKHIWDHHEKELRASGAAFYTWQYDVRWAGMKLRRLGKLKPVDHSTKLPWELNGAVPNS